jgi:hypothetical protein
MLQKLQRVIADLEKNELITIDNQEIAEPADGDLVAAMKTKYRLADDVLKLWTECNGLSLSWTGVVDDYELKGGIEIRSLEEVLGDWDGRVYFDDTPKDDLKRKFHPFDTYDADLGSGQYTGLLLDGSANPKVLYHDTDLELHDLAPSLSSYLDMFATTRGGLYWQAALVAHRTGGHGDEELLDMLPKLFPGFSMKKL